MKENLDKILIDKGIKFLPWIGDEYFNSNPRILILGESHYFNEDLSENKELMEEYNNHVDTTRDVVEDYSNKSYQNIAAMLTNKIIEHDIIWEFICFYNFFQKHVGFSSSDKSLIDDSLIEMSRKAFFCIIESLTPDLIIAWGATKLYWEWLPQDNCEFIDEDNKLFKYKQFPKTAVWNINHPSSPMFNLYDWTFKFKDIICKKLDFSYPIK